MRQSIQLIACRPENDFVDPEALARQAVRVSPGEYAISRSKPLYTLLGSCVSACITDPEKQIGGINHFLLPDGSGQLTEAARYGVFAMEQLINELLLQGAKRERMVAKVSGGARMFQGGLDIGQRNIAFVRTFLRTERIQIAAAHVGGSKARRVVYIPNLGIMFVRPVSSGQQALIQQEEKQLTSTAATYEGTVDLF